MEDKNEVLLKVEHLCQYFKMGAGRELKAVDDVSFQVFQGEQDVIQYREMRIQSIVLKHHSHAAFFRRQGGDILIAKENMAGCGLFQSTDHV